MEVRNITPNYTNNNTSFGMAFRKPTGEQMESFAQYVGQKASGEPLKKALDTIIGQQAKNKHFDITYDYSQHRNRFCVVAKSDEAINKYGDVTRVYEEGSYDEVTEAGRLLQKRKAIMKAEGWSKARRFISGVISLPKLVMATIRDSKDPLRVLPDNMRYAAMKATRFEQDVERLIARENLVASAFDVK